MKSTAASRAARLKELEAKQRKASGKLSLEDLAPELRNRIYDYALIEWDPDFAHVDCAKTGNKLIVFNATGAKRLKQPGLTQVSRKIRSEILPVFYGANKFEIWLYDGGNCIAGQTLAWLRAIGLENRRRLLNLDIVACRLELLETVLMPFGFDESMLQDKAQAEHVRRAARVLFEVRFAEKSVERPVACWVHPAAR